MSISSLLERLREKPKEVRVQVSFLSALCVTGVIGLLWGVTLPTRLQGLSQSDQGETESQDGLYSFFTNTRNNLGQLIGATDETADDAQNETNDNAPKSNAYRAGAPIGGSDSYGDYSLEEQEPPVIPVDRREVRIGTTTKKSE